MQNRKKENHAEKLAVSPTPAKQDARAPATFIRGEETSHIANALWFTEKQVMPLLSPFWSWRLQERP